MSKFENVLKEAAKACYAYEDKSRRARDRRKQELMVLIDSIPNRAAALGEQKIDSDKLKWYIKEMLKNESQHGLARKIGVTHNVIWRFVNHDVVSYTSSDNEKKLVAFFGNAILKEEFKL